ncbi:MAG: hypothetical protein ACRENP_07645 [Longimicrobiales bacterium]
MHAWSEAAQLRAFLARVARRRTALAATQGAASALAFASAILLGLSITGWWTGRPLGWLVIVSAGLLLLGTGLGALSSRVSRRRVALLVEARAPESRNLIVTAAELMEAPSRGRSAVVQLVWRQADTLAMALDAATLFPARRALAVLSASAALCALATLLTAARSNAARAAGPSASLDAAVSSVVLVVAPPAYTGLPEETLRNPARVQAVAGSLLRVSVQAQAAAVTIETLNGRQSLAVRESQTFIGQVPADADGYLAIEARASDGRSGARKLIGLSVTPDRMPRVRLTAPGRDLFLADARRTIAVVVEANDDLALAQLQLRYTRVYGSGERFTFTDGTLPLQIDRTNQKTWRARADLKLETLGLAPGDMLVYRGLASDKRPGAPPAESDAFIIEITAPGAIAAEGFALDDEERDRYGISQQMVVLKTERLLARASTLAPDSLAREALTLAAEQRSVRAEFVFMMGGELAEEVLEAANLAELNEEEHAAADEEVLAGRLANRGRIELMRAIRSMSRASTALNIANLTEALKQERAALIQLQRAFARTRYILRALTQRERLDLSRRLTGLLNAAGSDVRPAPQPDTNARITALRQVLANIATLAARPDASSILASAQNLLRIDPSDPHLQQVAAQLAEAATASAQERARTKLDQAASGLATSLKRELPSSPRNSASLDLKRLEGALIDALRTTARNP